jgi:hypothetical protein
MTRASRLTSTPPTFKDFQRAIRSRRHAAIWKRITKSLKDASPGGRLPAKVARAIKPMVTKYAWASFEVSPPSGTIGTGRHTFVRRRALEFLRDLRQFEKSWAALEAADSNLVWLFQNSPRHPAAGHAMFVEPGLSAILNEMRDIATSVEKTLRNKGGRPRGRKYEGLVALCARLFMHLTNQRPSGFKSDSFSTLMLAITELLRRVSHDLPGFSFWTPLSDEAIRRKIQRLLQ